MKRSTPFKMAVQNTFTPLVTVYGKTFGILELIAIALLTNKNMMKNNFYCLLCFLLCLAPNFLFAQPSQDVRTNYAGKDFWIALQEVTRITEVIATSKHNATLTITYTANNTSQTYAMQAGTVLKITMNQIALATTNVMETVSNKSVHIVSDSNVVIQLATYGNKSDDGMLIYPSDRQQYGNLFYLNTLPELPIGNNISDRGGSFSIVATCDNVVLEITPKKATVTNQAGVPFTLQLNKGEAYTMANHGYNLVKDLSGTKIEVKSASCCNPINVFNTNGCTYAYWPYNGIAYLACDLYLEQILPTSSWDTVYPIVPYVNNPYTIIKIVSSANNNIIRMDGNVIATLQDGGTIDTIIKRPVIVAAQSPISISQNMVGESVSYFNNGNPYDPDMMPIDSMSDPNAAIVVALRDGIKEAYFNTVGQSYENFGTIIYNQLHRLVLVSRSANVNTVTLNNINLASSFLPFPGNTAYQYAVIKPDTGVLYHLLSEDRIVAHYYAATSTGSIDFHLGDVNPVDFYTELPTDTILACITDTVTLSDGDGFIFKWSTGANSQQIRVSDTGLYHVIVYNDDDCPGRRKRFYIQRPLTYLTGLDVGPDTTICIGHSIALNGAGPATEWSDGNTGNQMLVNAPGTYWATIRDTCLGIFLTDTITVVDTLCPHLYCDFNLPNAFSPNGDGMNDVFKPAPFGTISDYSLSVYNRYGERVFSSFVVEKGWDGTYRGIPLDLGIYYYYCRFYCPLKGNLELKGDVTLIR